MTSAAGDGRRSGADNHEARGLARAAVGSARVLAFAVSNVAPAGPVVAGLVMVVSRPGRRRQL